MSEQAALHQIPVLYLGGTRRPTDFQILQVASGKPVQDPEILGQGPIRGTREEFRSHLEQVVKDLRMTDSQRNGLPHGGKMTGDEFFLSRQRQRQLNLGAALLGSLEAPDRQGILRELADRFVRVPAWQAELNEIEKLVATKESR